MSYDHGRFVWFELLTKDTERAASFYTKTLPWRIEPMTMQDGSQYTLIKAGDTALGGIVSPAGDAPNAWVSYVSVADVDSTAERIKAAGGAAHMDAFEMPGVGRMQPVGDPLGAAFCLFKGETGDSSPAEGPGSVSWNELWTPDPQASLSFYKEVFAYTHEELPMPNGTYCVLKQGDAVRAGLVEAPNLVQAPNKDVPSLWLQYITVDDCDETLDRAKENGASIVAAPADAGGVGRFGILRDPMGGMLGVIKPSSG